MGQLLQNLGEIWRRANLTQRLLLVSVILACIGASILLVNWARKPSLSLLYSHLAPEEASKIVDKLRDEGVAYELKDSGTTIYCDQEKVYSMRLNMASQGMPTGDQGGYRILDDEKIGSSPFTQQVNFKRALEGELAKTIEMIDGVVKAKVIVAKPETSLFAGKDKDTSASVTVTLRAGKRLTPGNVAAIVNLTAGSVEGLSSGRVVVVDSQGNLLSGESEGSEIAKKANSFLDYKTQVEEYLANKTEQMLTTVLGPGRATIKVDAVVDISSTSQTIETYDPLQKVISKEELKTRSTPAAKAASGGNAQGSLGGGTKEENSTTDYLVSRTTKQEVNLPGNIKDVKVAAFVDLSVPVDKDGKPASTPLKSDDVKKLIANAMGLKATDQIELIDTPFRKSDVVAAAELPDGMFTKDFILEIAKRGSLGLMVIGALLALRIVGGKKKAVQPAMASGGAAGVLEGGSQNLLPGAEADPEVLRSRITRALQENPEEVKRLFLSWVETEKGEV